MSRVTEPHALRFRGQGDIELRADGRGDPEWPPVVLLHGGGQTRHAWGGTAEALAREGWYAVSVDLRGHGDSSWADDGDYHFESFAADTLAVCATFKQPPVLVGASLGGLSALLAEGESHPSVARAVVLVDVAVRMEPQGVGRIIEFMRARPEGFRSLEEAADAVAEYLPHRRRPKDLSGLAKNLRRRPDGRYRWHWDPMFMEGGRRPAALHARDRLVDAARSLRVPTLLVRGRLSDLLSEEGARHFLDAVPHARYVDVSGAGHMVAGDNNDAFTQAVLDFLHEEVDDRRGRPPGRSESS